MLNVDRWYRGAVLGVAGRPQVERLLRTRGWGLAKRFVAGETLPEAIAAVRRLEADGILGILDLLGEMVADATAAQAFTERILEIFPALAEASLSGYVSIKLSQIGQDLPGPGGEPLALSNARRILQKARETSAFVCIDMEDCPRVERTLEQFRQLHAEFGEQVGLVLQSYLRRSEDDQRALLPLHPTLRIVKGAYSESPEVAYPEKWKVDAAYLRMVYRQLAAGLPVAVATHDPRILRSVLDYAQRNAVPRELLEFQMLYGVRSDLQRQLAAQGQRVRAYIPFGPDWYAYFSRRIAERPANVAFVLRGLFQS